MKLLLVVLMITSSVSSFAADVTDDLSKKLSYEDIKSCKVEFETVPDEVADEISTMTFEDPFEITKQFNIMYLQRLSAKCVYLLFNIEEVRLNLPEDLSDDMVDLFSDK